MKKICYKVSSTAILYAALQNSRARWWTNVCNHKQGEHSETKPKAIIIICIIINTSVRLNCLRSQLLFMIQILRMMQDLTHVFFCRTPM